MNKISEIKKRYLLIIAFFLSNIWSYGQEDYSNFITAEYTLGKTSITNTGFPDVGLHQAWFFNFGSFQNTNSNEWAHRLKQPKTGISVGLARYGHDDILGYSISVLPNIELQLGASNFSIHLAFGAAYFNKTFDLDQNLQNEKIATHLNFSYRTMLFYNLSKEAKTNWRLGVGYFHQSNGHTRFPNQGLNSFSASISAELAYTPEKQTDPFLTNQKESFTDTKSFFVSARRGLGMNAFTEELNDRRPVHVTSVSAGLIINKTYKIGLGVFHKFYRHYYDYIELGEDLLPDYPYLADHPYINASAIGVSAIGEFQLNHIGMEVELGFNISKPFFTIDYIINSGYSYTNTYPGTGPVTFRVLGELDEFYKLKRLISTRMGLKYYFIGTEQAPTHNVYVGAHINANLGQADFSEISLGYVYSMTLN
ncbi:hypothetical protein SCB49_12414 [unidentified eubacterium SCB49]|nr:hypothetical protein SCB49_12414 [unidentified eubacterium SCB49]